MSFEWVFLSRKKSFYLVLLVSPALGLFIATNASFSFPNTSKNSPYVLSYLTGLASLLTIFSVTILAAQTLFREKDANFESILHALPIKRGPFITSRFLIVLGITTLGFLLLITGILIGYELLGKPGEELTRFTPWHYVQPFLLLALPNIFFCTAVICSIAWFTGNKLIVYIAGVFIYFSYWVIALYSNSPLVVSASPATAQAMDMAAKLDPFGLSAFFEQTRFWSAADRNTKLAGLHGNLLLNRLLYLTISSLIMVLVYSRFRFSRNDKKYSIEKTPAAGKTTIAAAFHVVNTKPAGPVYGIRCFLSFVGMDVRFIVRSIPFLLLCSGWILFYGIDIYGHINGGSRIPERFAGTGLMVNKLLESLPVFCLLVLLFYGSELFWRSRNMRFSALEQCTPVPSAAVFYAKWFSLALIPLLLMSLSILVSVIIQLLLQNSDLNWKLYASLFYLAGLPLFLCAGIIISLQSLFQHKYMALVASAIILAFTSTNLAGMMGLHHPLIRFTGAFRGNYSDMTGWGPYIRAFHWKIVFGTGVVVLLALLATRPAMRMKSVPRRISAVLAMVMVMVSAYTIMSNTNQSGLGDVNDRKQAYEEKYRKYEHLSQPGIAEVSTAIDLFPEENSYRVSGSYTLVNHSGQPIDTLLLYQDADMKDLEVRLPNSKLLLRDESCGHRMFRLEHPLRPDDSIRMSFRFNYSWSAFRRHSFPNTIVENGTFIRISNYFPVFGYQADNEISDAPERVRRGMSSARALKSVDHADSTTDPHQFIRFSSVISTGEGQTAIGVGEPVRNWKRGNRNYFEYRASSPIPFRFAVASARYEVRKIQFNGYAFDVYYHSGHTENIGHLLDAAKETLAYCEKNFGKYPFRTLHIAEISAFTNGAAGTAYPNSFFINEQFGFQNKVAKDPNKDILYELVSHELSHAWWGNTRLNPNWQEGSKILTETLAMYTELMLYKKVYGEASITDRVRVHKDIYLSERALSDEEPLYRSDPGKPHLCYNKGMVVMYQLYKMLGEENVNRALKGLLRDHAYPGKPPTSLDFLEELYLVSEASTHPAIDELFKKIITHDIRLNAASLQKQTISTMRLHLDAALLKYEEDGKGNKKKLAFPDAVDLLIRFKNFPDRIIRVPVKDGLISHAISLTRQPIYVELDPMMKLMDIDREDNGYLPAFK